MTELTILSEYGSLMLRGTLICVCRLTKLSNRCFQEKAVAAWLQTNDQGRIEIVEGYLRDAGNWKELHGLDRSPRRMFSDPLYAVIARSAEP